MDVAQDCIVRMHDCGTERAVTANPTDYNPLVILVAANGYLGRLEEADRILVRMNELLRKDQLPEFTIDSLHNRWPYKDQAQRAHLIEGFRRAGVPKW